MTILETAICNLKDEIMLSNYFNKLYEYAEIIHDGDKSYPQAYLANGNYTRVYDFDINGSGYIRKNGSVSTSVVGSSTVACSDTNPMIDITVPLRLVCAVPKSKLSDNGFSDDTLAFDLIGYIGRRQSAVTGATSVTGRVMGYSTDRNQIWSQEVRGIDKQLLLTLSFIAIDFTITIRAPLDCISQNCNY